MSPLNCFPIFLHFRLGSNSRFCRSEPISMVNGTYTNNNHSLFLRLRRFCASKLLPPVDLINSTHTHTHDQRAETHHLPFCARFKRQQHTHTVLHKLSITLYLAIDSLVRSSSASKGGINDAMSASARVVCRYSRTFWFVKCQHVCNISAHNVRPCYVISSEKCGWFGS